MMRKFFNFVTKIAIIAVIIWWLKGIYVEKIYNAPVAVADRLESASAEVYEQKLAEAEKIAGDAGIKIVIDACAGGEDCGINYGGINEKDITVNTAVEISKLIEKKDNIVVFLTRNQDVSLSDRQREELVNIVKPDFYIRLELAEDKGAEVFGTEVLYSDSFYDYRLSNSEYAARLETAICDAVQNRSIGIKNIVEENNIWLENRHIPSAIIKMGYISNDKEREALASPLYQQKFAKGIEKAIVECIDENYSENAENNITEEVEE